MRGDAFRQAALFARHRGRPPRATRRKVMCFSRQEGNIQTRGRAARQ